MMASKTNKQIYKVNLVFDLGITRSVFIKAKSREAAERRALSRNPNAVGTSKSPFPQN